MEIKRLKKKEKNPNSAKFERSVSGARCWRLIRSPVRHAWNEFASPKPQQVRGNPRHAGHIGSRGVGL
jgi:hypothetical protein